MPGERALQRWVNDVRLDTHRLLRRGHPEVVFAEGKSAVQLRRIVRRFSASSHPLLLTRLDSEAFESLGPLRSRLRYHPLARLAHDLPRRRRLKGFVLVVCAGTSDVGVAEEAVATLQWLGSRAGRLYDVGVAGVHRLLNQWKALRRARVIIVIAGMEGALASVVGGLVAAPVVAVPTSIGYGAGFQGIAPLLAMLNSCVPGIGVVNIDNGFGAAYLAHLINAPQR